jgi:hypothetical protein
MKRTHGSCGFGPHVLKESAMMNVVLSLQLAVSLGMVADNWFHNQILI